MHKFNTYLIQWYGPFSSKEALEKWEQSRSEVFNLYAFRAKRKGKKNKYYCGMTYKQTVGKRMRNHDHHIHDYENEKTEILQIWIGTIANIKPKEYDIRICENFITSVLAGISVGEKHLENLTNKRPPLVDVYIINEWWKTNGNELKIKACDSVPASIPEAMVYYSGTNSLYGAKKLKFIGNL